MLVRDFTDGLDVDQVLLVREIEARVKRDGAEYLRVRFADRTGSVPAMVWEGVDEVRAVCRAGEPVRVVARFTEHARFGGQLALRALRPAQPGSFDPAELCDGPPRSAAAMEADLRALVATVQDPWLQRLLDRLLGPASPTWPRYRDAPAAKHYHQAYRHGLLEHCLSVAEGVSAVAAAFGGVDRDVAVTGALLHDIGKLDAYTADAAAIDLSDLGRLQGEIPLGYYRIRREIEDIDGFPEPTAAAVLHIILSHHGSLEHGSPVVPCTREATLVHFLDNLGGRLGSFDRLEKELPAGQTWSAFDRALGAGAFFGFAAAGTAAHATPADPAASVAAAAPAAAAIAASAAGPAPAAQGSLPVAPDEAGDAGDAFRAA